MKSIIIHTNDAISMYEYILYLLILLDKCEISEQILEPFWKMGYNFYANVDEIENHEAIPNTLHIESPNKVNNNNW